MIFRFVEERPIRRIGLTPMIDVVFLLLVFFMLVARFGADRVVPIVVGGAGGEWSGPPRLVEVEAEGFRLNGIAVSDGDLLSELARLTRARTDTVVVSPSSGINTARLIEAIGFLRDAGFTTLAVVGTQ